MKNLLLPILILTFTIYYNNINAQILKEAQKVLGNVGFTEKDAADAIKEALSNGTNNSVNIVSKVDGYFKNPEIKIPFPQDAQLVESKLRAVGLNKPVDDVVLSVNRAAEDAAKQAAPIFLAVIKSMTITDAINIVKGNNDAATKYLKKSTSRDLRAKFKPVIKASLDKVNATKYWSTAINAYNKIPMVKKMNPNLTDYVTSKAIEGLFVMIAKEELKIRQDPVARTSDLLKKVFGQ